MEHKKKSLIIILALSVVGFADATFLAMKKMIGSPIICLGSNGCGVVDASSYSNVAGIPLSILGSLFYAVTILLLVQYLLRKQKRILDIAMVTLIAGGIFSVYLILLQAFVIKAWCYYCIVSDTIGIINALLIIRLMEKKK